MTPDARFKRYWEDALSAVQRQLASADRSCRSLRDQRAPEPRTLHSIADELRGKDTSGRVGATVVVTRQVVSEKNPQFEPALNWLQAELLTLIESLGCPPDKTSLTTIKNTLSLDAEQTREHFGSLTTGWDTLVKLRQSLLPQTSMPPRLSWFVSQMTEFERALGESVCLAIQHFGREPIVLNAALITAREFDIPVPAATMMRHERTEDGLAQAFSDFIRTGADETAAVAHRFCSEMHQGEVELAAFNDRICKQMLGDLGDTREGIIHTLLAWQNDILHATRVVDGHVPADAATQTLRTATFDYLERIVQFLVSESLLTSLRVMRAINKVVSESRDTRELAANALFKAAAELRVSDLILLTNKRFWLAWSLAEAVGALGYEDSQRLMLKYNAVYAQSKLPITGWRKQLVGLTPNAEARYQIIHKTLSGDFNEIEKLMQLAIDNRDMTPEEFDEWPVLESLRDRADFHEMLARVSKGNV